MVIATINIRHYIIPFLDGIVVCLLLGFQTGAVLPTVKKTEILREGNATITTVATASATM